MNRALLVVLVVAATLSSCRYLGTLTPLRTDNSLTSTQPTSDPTRQGPIVSRRCLVECGAGFVCNERLAECEAVKLTALDGGASWLP